MTAASKTPPTVGEAWAAVMDEVQSVGKTGRNQKQGYNFRGIDAVVNAVGPILRKHKVLVLPSLRTWEHGTVEVGKDRTPMGHARVEVDYTIHGPAGDTLPGSAPGEAMDSGDKATAKAMSVAYRTFLIQALCLPTDEPDPDEHSYERAPARPAGPPPTFEELLLDAEHAASSAALDALANRTKASLAAGGITAQQLNKIREVVTARRADLANQTSEGSAA